MVIKSQTAVLILKLKLPVLTFLLVLLGSASLPAQQKFKDFNFKKADSVAFLYPGHSLMNLASLADKLTLPFSSDEEKFRAIYTWVCVNIENDYELYRETSRKREKLVNQPGALEEWNKKLNGQVFKKLIADRKTICSGYAYLIKELSTLAGLSCVTIGGYGRTAKANIGGPGIPNHSWNAVKIKNKWYLCDATWSSGALDLQAGKFVPKFDDSYFLADPALFVRNHYPLDSAWSLGQGQLSLKEFLNRPLVYSSIYDYGIDQLSPETFNIVAAKGETVSFCFRKNSETDIGKVDLLINGSINSPIVRNNADGMYCFDHTFGGKGTYIVHGRIDSRNVFTYTVEVN